LCPRVNTSFMTVDTGWRNIFGFRKRFRKGFFNRAPAVGIAVIA
jgi:hypothetical protein